MDGSPVFPEQQELLIPSLPVLAGERLVKDCEELTNLTVSGQERRTNRIAALKCPQTRRRPRIPNLERPIRGTGYDLIVRGHAESPNVLSMTWKLDGMGFGWCGGGFGFGLPGDGRGGDEVSLDGVIGEREEKLLSSA